MINKELMKAATHTKPLKRQQQMVRDRITAQAGKIAHRMMLCVTGEPDENGDVVTMTPVQAGIAGKLLDKVVPNLQSVDSTVTDKRSTLTEAEAMARLARLLEAHPELAKALANRPATVDGTGVPVDPGGALESAASAQEGSEPNEADSAALPNPDGASLQDSGEPDDSDR